MTNSTANNGDRNKYKNINRYIIDNAVIELAKALPENTLVLDIGAGGGHYRECFARSKYFAIDYGFEQGNYQGLDVAGDIYRLPFKDATVDCAVCIEVLEHLFEPEIFLDELHRVLKKGATLFLTTPFCIGEHMQPYDFFRYTAVGLDRLLTSNGFKVQKMRARGGYFVFLIYHLRKFPEYLSSSENLSVFGKKLIRKSLNLVFAYIIPGVLYSLDRFDKRRDTCLGYICTAVKTN